MAKAAILFPGQGSQTPDMRETVARAAPRLLAADHASELAEAHGLSVAKDNSPQQIVRELGVEKFIEVGPGRVLTGLAKRTLSGVELVNA